LFFKTPLAIYGGKLVTCDRFEQEFELLAICPNLALMNLLDAFREHVKWIVPKDERSGCDALANSTKSSRRFFINSNCSYRNGSSPSRFKNVVQTRP
jgi:hypothetical protein